MNYAAVIGDVVASRLIPDRIAFQRRFQEAVKALNQRPLPPHAPPGIRRRQDLASPYTITLGDEVQALYRHTKELFRDLLTLSGALHPHRIRFAVGLGPLTTPINPDEAIGMDGPAFHEARDGIDRLKKAKELVTVRGAANQDIGLENDAARLLSTVYDSWKRNRWQVLDRLISGAAIRDIASDLGITQTAVYKNISGGALEIVLSLSDHLGDSLERKIRQMQV